MNRLAGPGVELDVVVPALRTATVDRLLRSLSLGSDRPDVVTLVSNEVPEALPTYGLAVRVVRFSSRTLPIGDRDLALRRDIGLWASNCRHVVTLDDDLVAAGDLVAAARRLLAAKPCFWGHHRFISFRDHTVEELVGLPPDRGRSRELGVNRWHLWMSCYGGLFGAEASLVREVGGFDLVFCCRQAGEDQHLGRRLAYATDRSERVFIHEPPFAWHPTEPEPWGPPGHSNLCAGEHQLAPGRFGAVPVDACTRCPWFRVRDEAALSGNRVNRPYDPAAVDLTVVWARPPA